MSAAFLCRLSVGGFLVFSSCFHLAAGGEIFHCVAKNGLPLYQNFPCQFDSLSQMGGSPALASAGVQTPVQITREAQPHTGATNLIPGMTSDEIWTTLGQPVEIISNPVSGHGSEELWRYADKRIQFGADHVVLSVQKCLTPCI